MTNFHPGRERGMAQLLGNLKKQNISAESYSGRKAVRCFERGYKHAVFAEPYEKGVPSIKYFAPKKSLSFYLEAYRRGYDAGATDAVLVVLVAWAMNKEGQT